jgi:hypothetical protein
MEIEDTEEIILIENGFARLATRLANIIRVFG